MKYLLLSLAGLSLTACGHGPEVAAEPTHTPVIFAFKAVDSARTVNAEPKADAPKGDIAWGSKSVFGDKKAEKKPVEKPAPKMAKNKNGKNQKFIAVTPCKDAECKTEATPKLVPVEKFSANIREKIKKSGDLVDKQEHLLAQDLVVLKSDLLAMAQNKAYYDEQIVKYRYASLKPVIDSYKKASVGIAKDIKVFEHKIQKFEQDLNHLRNMKSGSVAGDAPTAKIMQLVEAGHWDVGSELPPEKRILWNFFQSVGAELAAND